jgi:hypothetical protein
MHIPPAAPGTVLGPAKPSWQITCTYPSRQKALGQSLPNFQNNDPCTSNCGNLILIEIEPTKPTYALPIITYENLGFSARITR